MSAPSTTFPGIRRNSVRILPIFVSLSSVLLITAGTVVGILAHIPDNVIVPGVQVSGLKLGGKNLEEARSLLLQLAENRKSLDIGMHFADDTGVTRTWKADAHKLGLGIDVDTTLEDARRAGRTSIVGQVSQYVSGARPVSVPVRVTIDNTQLRAYLKEIAYRINRKPKNAGLVLKGNTIVDYTHDQSGLAMDVSGSQDIVAQAWARYNAQQPLTPATVAIPTASPTRTPIVRPANQDANPSVLVDPNAHAKPTGQSDSTVTTPPTTAGSTTQNTQTVQSDTVPASPTTSTAPDNTPSVVMDVELLAKVTPANITYAEIKKIDGIIGSWTTDIGGSSNRHSNVGLATSHINGTMLRPGEIFSYNKIVGPRDQERGFKEAPEIVRGVLQPGIGGGVCQVSSTLYNAVLRANLKIINRSHHAFPVHYVKEGLDATVVDGSIDFQFQNDTDAPIYIYGLGHNGVLRFRIFGKQVPGREVELVRSKFRTKDYPTETQNDPNLPIGHRDVKVAGHPDLEVTWFRVIKQDGVEVKREQLSTHYHAIPEVVTVGTRPRVHAPVKPTVPTPTSTPAPTPTPPVSTPPVTPPVEQ